MPACGVPPPAETAAYKHRRGSQSKSAMVHGWAGDSPKQVADDSSSSASQWNWPIPPQQMGAEHENVGQRSRQHALITHGSQTTPPRDRPTWPSSASSPRVNAVTGGCNCHSVAGGGAATAATTMAVTASRAEPQVGPKRSKRPVTSLLCKLGMHGGSRSCPTSSSRGSSTRPPNTNAPSPGPAPSHQIKELQQHP